MKLWSFRAVSPPQKFLLPLPFAALANVLYFVYLRSSYSQVYIFSASTISPTFCPGLSSPLRYRRDLRNSFSIYTVLDRCYLIYLFSISPTNVPFEMCNFPLQVCSTTQCPLYFTCWVGCSALPKGVNIPNFPPTTCAFSFFHTQLHGNTECCVCRPYPPPEDG